jgi:hypothetical protein
MGRDALSCGAVVELMNNLPWLGTAVGRQVP